MNVLIVDDEERIRSVFCQIMEREGFEVFEAASAGDAYNLILSHSMDLVLLDINMMEVDGTVLFEVLHLFCKKAKVIVTSVYPLEDQKKLIKGAQDYYDKSDSLQVLIYKVRKLMGNDLQSAKPKTG